MSEPVERVALRIVNAPGQPYPNARRFLLDTHHEKRGNLLINQGGVFYAWTGPHWDEIEDAALYAQLYVYFDAADYMFASGKKPPGPRPFDPSRHKILDLRHALVAATLLPVSVVAPAWMDASASAPASEFVSASNGLLHVPTRTLTVHTPQMYNHQSVPFAYRPRAAQPRRWLAFLHDLWPEDPESVALLRMWFGYVLSGSTSHQKMLMIVGPKRSGKSTVARILKALIGAHQVAGPTLSNLATDFGLQPLIGKALAVISDARITTNQAVVIERLLSISGEDLLTIDRKYRSAWTGTLASRITVLTNELPRLVDSSGALASRFLILLTSTSFFGSENIHLTEELLTELPGILNWALDGLDALSTAGRFTQPASSADAVREMDELTSPVMTFVRERCKLDPAARIPVPELYLAWKQWCWKRGSEHVTTEQVFGRDLRSAIGHGLKITQPRDGSQRRRDYEGIRLLLPNEAP